MGLSCIYSKYYKEGQKEHNIHSIEEKNTFHCLPPKMNDVSKVKLKSTLQTYIFNQAIEDNHPTQEFKYY